MKNVKYWLDLVIKERYKNNIISNIPSIVKRKKAKSFSEAYLICMRSKEITDNIKNELQMYVNFKHDYCNDNIVDINNTP